MTAKTDLTVGVCILHDNTVLLVKHARLGKWLLPGGHVEPGEMPSDAAVREVREETSLEIKFSDYGPVKETHDTTEKMPVPFDVNRHNVGDHDHYNMSYLATMVSGTPTKSEESTDIGWFGKEQIAHMDNIPENVRAVALFCLEK